MPSEGFPLNSPVFNLIHDGRRLSFENLVCGFFFVFDGRLFLKLSDDDGRELSVRIFDYSGQASADFDDIDPESMVIPVSVKQIEFTVDTD